MHQLVIGKRACITFTAALLLMLMYVIATKAGAHGHTGTQLYLVSVGNGDPDNITLRAMNTIKDSDSLPYTGKTWGSKKEQAV